MFFFGDCPKFGFGAKGIVDVDVKTGRSALLTDAGVAVLGGSHRRGSCCTVMFMVGPSGWYGINTSAPEDEDEDGRAGVSGLKRGEGELGKGI
jgi:hypothetical protein